MSRRIKVWGTENVNKFISVCLYMTSLICFVPKYFQTWRLLGTCHWYFLRTLNTLKLLSTGASANQNTAGPPLYVEYVIIYISVSPLQEIILQDIFNDLPCWHANCRSKWCVHWPAEVGKKQNCSFNEPVKHMLMFLSVLKCIFMFFCCVIPFYLMCFMSYYKVLLYDGVSGHSQEKHWEEKNHFTKKELKYFKN